MHRPALDLDQAALEIEQRWFVWTAAGLRVHPLTWTDRVAPRHAPLVGRSDVTTPRSLGLRVSRPNSQADIVLYADGWADTAVRRPDAQAAVHAAAQVDSAEAFGLFLDRVVELIAWSGTGRNLQHSDPVVSARPPRAVHWVLGFDGMPLPIAR
jgi:hypothetical protein